MRGLRPAIALGRQGTCPRAGPPSPRPSRSASEVARSRLSAVSHTRPNHSPVSLQRPVCRGPRTVPRSRFFFFVSFWYDTNGRYIYLQARPMRACLTCHAACKYESFNHPFALQQSIRLVYTLRALSRGRNREGTTRMHTHRNSTHSATETKHNSQPETTKGSWPLLLPRRRCCCCCCCCCCCAATVLLLLHDPRCIAEHKPS